MNIRRDPIYLSSEVWRACWLLAKARSPEPNEGGHIMTADQMADDLLRDILNEKFPKLLEHQKTVEKMERELLKNL